MNALVGANASPATKDKFRKQLRDGELDDKEIEIQIAIQAAFRVSKFPECRAAPSA